MDLDFMGGVPWASGWKTDAFECVAKFVVDALREPYAFPPFSFRIWTDKADELAMDLTRAHFNQEIIEVGGGPGGGGPYSVVDPLAMTPDGRPDYGGSECVEIPKLGSPASFTLMLTGTPRDSKWLTQTASRYRLVEKRRGD